MLVNKQIMVDAIQQCGFVIQSEDRMTNNVGEQIRLTNGAIVNVYDKGTWNVQGRNNAEVKQQLEGCLSTDSPKMMNRNVFVVYGHDVHCKTALEALLRRWELKPFILDQLPSEGQTIIEKLESTTGKCSFGIILATPDDMGHRVGHEDEKQYRARQNVVLEMGMLLAKLGRKRIAILVKEQTDMERPSDISGLMYIPFKDSIDDAKVMLFKELNQAGIPISSDKL